MPWKLRELILVGAAVGIGVAYNVLAVGAGNGCGATYHSYRAGQVLLRGRLLSTSAKLEAHVLRAPKGTKGPRSRLQRQPPLRLPISISWTTFL